MIDIPNFSPGCFGSALAFEETAPVCTVCKFAAECKPLHLENLKALRDALGIFEKKKRSKPAPAAAQIEEPVLTKPKKTQALLDKIERAGLKVTEAFAAGTNPFENVGMGFMRVVAHMLLRSQRPLDRETIAYALATTLKWQDTTADSHARQAMQALADLGAVDVVDGRIQLRRLS